MKCFRILCDHRIPIRYKVNFIEQLYDNKKTTRLQKSVTKIRMFRWMTGKTIRDRMRNEFVRVRDI